MSAFGSMLGLAPALLAEQPASNCAFSSSVKLSELASGAVRAVVHRAAVKRIGPAAGDHVERQAAVRVLGRSRAHHEVGFLERVRIQVQRGDGRVAVERGDVHAVDGELVLVGRAADAGRRLQERFGAADVELVQDDARNDAGDRPHVGAVRQRFEHFAGDDGLLHAVDVSSSGDWPLTVMASSTVPISSLKSARETWSEFTWIFALLDGSKSLQLRPDAVGARHEARELICALLVGHRGLAAADAAAIDRERDGDAGQHRSRRSDDGAANRTDALRRRWRHRHQHRQQHPQTTEYSQSHHESPLSLRRTSA